jgi:hypothetical protein
MPRIYDPLSDVCDAEERAMLSLRRDLMKLPPALFAAAVSVASAPALGAPAPIPTGARVEARCKGSPLFYPGKVLRANAVHPRPSPSSPSSSSPPPSSSTAAATAELTEAACSYAVEFDDGDVDRRVPRAHIHNLYPAPRVRAAAPPTATAAGGGTKRAASQQSPEALSVSSPLGPAAAAAPPSSGADAAPSPTAEARSSPSPPAPLHGRADLTELDAATVSDLRDILREHREGPQCFCVCRTPTPWRERRLLAKCHGKGGVRGAAKQPCSGRVHPECFGIASYAPGSSSGAAAAAGDSGAAAAGDSGGSAAQGGGGVTLGGQPVETFCCDLCSYLSEGKVLDVIVAVEAEPSKGNTKGLSCPFCSGTKGSYQAWVGPFLDPTNGTALGWAHIECALAAAGAGCEAATGRWFNVAEALRAACEASCAMEGCARRPQGLGPGKGASVPCAFDGDGGICPNRMHLPCCTRVGDKAYCPAHAHASAGSGAKRQKVITDSNS